VRNHAINQSFFSFSLCCCPKDFSLIALTRDQNIKVMANRIKDMRKALRDALVERKTPGNWDHIVNQIGMFTYTGLTGQSSPPPPPPPRVPHELMNS